MHRLRSLVNKMSGDFCPRNLVTSIHGDQIEEVHDVPMSIQVLYCITLHIFVFISIMLTGVIIRPFPPELNHAKVDSLMETLQVHSLYNRKE